VLVVVVVVAVGLCGSLKAAAVACFPREGLDKKSLAPEDATRESVAHSSKIELDPTFLKMGNCNARGCFMHINVVLLQLLPYTRALFLSIVLPHGLRSPHVLISLSPVYTSLLL
jgi:hypothetical protein